MIALLLLAQAAPAEEPHAADIELSARVRAEKVEIEAEGVELEVYASPEGASAIDVEGPPEGGRKSYRNIDIRLHAAARIGDPERNEPELETEVEVSADEPETR
ncbi:MAG: hypothetical protein ACFBQW_06485 [Sphingomonadaceae bacterium]